MFKNYRRTQDEVEELNMLPIMNLFIVLIPFLLAAAAFYQVAVIPASTPQHTPNTSDVPSKPVIVTLNIVVKPEAIEVTASSTGLKAEELETLSFQIDKQGGSYDLEDFQANLIEIKDKYPKSNTAVILPHESTAYRTLISILDKLREREVGPEQFEPLFPVSVFSQFVPPPPPGSEELDDAAAEEGGGETLDLTDDE